MYSNAQDGERAFVAMGVLAVGAVGAGERPPQPAGAAAAGYRLGAVSLVVGRTSRGGADWVGFAGVETFATPQALCPEAPAADALELHRRERRVLRQAESCLRRLPSPSVMHVCAASHSLSFFRHRCTCCGIRMPWSRDRAAPTGWSVGRLDLSDFLPESDGSLAATAAAAGLPCPDAEDPLAHVECKAMTSFMLGLSAMARCGMMQVRTLERAMDCVLEGLVADTAARPHWRHWTDPAPTA